MKPDAVMIVKANEAVSRLRHHCFAHWPLGRRRREQLPDDILTLCEAYQTLRDDALAAAPAASKPEAAATKEP